MWAGFYALWWTLELRRRVGTVGLAVIIAVTVVYGELRAKDEGCSAVLVCLIAVLQLCGYT
jgi:hypothetical protein